MIYELVLGSIDSAASRRELEHLQASMYPITLAFAVVGPPHRTTRIGAITLDIPLTDQDEEAQRLVENRILPVLVGSGQFAPNKRINNGKLRDEWSETFVLFPTKQACSLRPSLFWDWESVFVECMWARGRACIVLRCSKTDASKEHVALLLTYGWQMRRCPRFLIKPTLWPWRPTSALPELVPFEQPTSPSAVQQEGNTNEVLAGTTRLMQPPANGTPDPALAFDPEQTGLIVGQSPEGQLVRFPQRALQASLMLPDLQRDRFLTTLILRALGGYGIFGVVSRDVAETLRSNQRVRLIDGKNLYETWRIPWNVLTSAQMSAALEPLGLSTAVPAPLPASFRSILTDGLEVLWNEVIEKCTMQPPDDLAGVVLAGGGVFIVETGQNIQDELLSRLMQAVIDYLPACPRPLLIIRPPHLVPSDGNVIATQALQLITAEEPTSHVFVTLNAEGAYTITLPDDQLLATINDIEQTTAMAASTLQSGLIDGLIGSDDALSHLYALPAAPASEPDTFRLDDEPHHADTPAKAMPEAADVAPATEDAGFMAFDDSLLIESAFAPTSDAGPTDMFTWDEVTTTIQQSLTDPQPRPAPMPLPAAAAVPLFENMAWDLTDAGLGHAASDQPDRSSPDVSTAMVLPTAPAEPESLGLNDEQVVSSEQPAAADWYSGFFDDPAPTPAVEERSASTPLADLPGEHWLAGAFDFSDGQPAETNVETDVVVRVPFAPSTSVALDASLDGADDFLAAFDTDTDTPEQAELANAATTPFGQEDQAAPVDDADDATDDEAPFGRKLNLVPDDDQEAFDWLGSDENRPIPTWLSDLYEPSPEGMPTDSDSDRLTLGQDGLDENAFMMDGFGSAAVPTDQPADVFSFSVDPAGWSAFEEPQAAEAQTMSEAVAPFPSLTIPEQGADWSLGLEPALLDAAQAPLQHVLTDEARDDEGSTGVSAEARSASWFDAAVDEQPIAIPEPTQPRSWQDIVQGLQRSRQQDEAVPVVVPQPEPAERSSQQKPRRRLPHGTPVRRSVRQQIDLQSGFIEPTLSTPATTSMVIEEQAAVEAVDVLGEARPIIPAVSQPVTATDLAATQAADEVRMLINTAEVWDAWHQGQSVSEIVQGWNRRIPHNEAVIRAVVRELVRQAPPSTKICFNSALTPTVQKPATKKERTHVPSLGTLPLIVPAVTLRAAGTVDDPTVPVQPLTVPAQPPTVVASSTVDDWFTTPASGMVGDPTGPTDDQPILPASSTVSDPTVPAQPPMVIASSTVDDWFTMPVSSTVSDPTVPAQPPMVVASGMVSDPTVPVQPLTMPASSTVSDPTVPAQLPTPPTNELELFSVSSTEPAVLTQFGSDDELFQAWNTGSSFEELAAKFFHVTGRTGIRRSTEAVYCVVLPRVLKEFEMPLLVGIFQAVVEDRPLTEEQRALYARVLQRLGRSERIGGVVRDRLSHRVSLFLGETYPHFA